VAGEAKVATRIVFTLAAGALLAASLLASPASPRSVSDASARPLLGVVPGGSGSLLVRVDPRTLRPLPGRRLSLGPHLHSWALSPNGSRIAYSPHPGRVVHVADAKTLRPRGQLGFSEGGGVAWLTPRRLLWIESAGYVLADPVTRRPLTRKRIDGNVFGGVRARDRAVLLVAPEGDVGPSHLLIVDATGNSSSVDLDRIRSGYGRCSSSQPGVTIDPAGQRVFVAGTDGVLAVVELDTHAVSYHSLGGTAPAGGDACEYRWRAARWLGDGLIAISGRDRHDVAAAPGRQQMRLEPAGLQLVDVRSWTARVLDARADAFRFVDGQLIATGARWDTTVSPSVEGMGVAGYALDGEKRFHLFEGEQAWIVEAYDGRAYVSLERRPLAVVDLERGVVVGQRSTPVARLLLDDGVSLHGR
jgi:hypothetical protein